MEEFKFGPRDLVVLRQQDNLPVRLTEGYIVGPLGSVGWPELESTASQMIRALVSILELPENGLMIEEFSGLTPPFSAVGLVISATLGEAGDAVLERAEDIREVAQSYLALIQRRAKGGQGDLLGGVGRIDTSIDVRLQAQAQADLVAIGGKPIKTPMVLEFGANKLVLSGSFGAKPPQPRKSPERYQMVGRVVGLNSNRKRLQVFSEGEVEIECDPNRFAHRLRDAIHTPRTFVFGVLRSADAKGKEQQVLTDVEEIESPPDDPESLI